MAAVWRRTDGIAGMSFVRLAVAPDGNHADGVEIGGGGTGGWYVRYELETAPSWVTVTADVLVATRDDVRRRALRRGFDGNWSVDGTVLPSIAGALDLDLAASPFTNTLAIRRLNLEVGDTAELVAAWIDIPSLTVEAVAQRYERLPAEDGMDRYAYRSVQDSRTWLMTVDEDGLVVDYGGLAERVPAP